MKNILLLILCFVVQITWAQGPPTNSDESKTEIGAKEEVFQVVEVMPRFPGCEKKKGEDKEKEMCARQKMLKYIYSHLEYPEESRKKGVEGMVVIKFIIEKNGRLSNIKAVKAPNAELGKAGEKLISSMNMNKAWRPGYAQGQAIRVKYTLPIKYKISKNKKEKVKDMFIFK